LLEAEKYSVFGTELYAVNLLLICIAFTPLGFENTTDSSPICRNSVELKPKSAAGAVGCELYYDVGEFIEFA